MNNFDKIKDSINSVVSITTDEWNLMQATDRYLKLLKTNPKAVQLIPLYHLANYLGIAPKSLSRIRNTIFSSEK